MDRAEEVIRELKAKRRKWQSKTHGPLLRKV
jgi:hypothetical protein